MKEAGATVRVNSFIEQLVWRRCSKPQRLPYCKSIVVHGMPSSSVGVPPSALNSHAPTLLPVHASAPNEPGPVIRAATNVTAVFPLKRATGASPVSSEIRYSPVVSWSPKSLPRLQRNSFQRCGRRVSRSGPGASLGPRDFLEK